MYTSTFHKSFEMISINYLQKLVLVLETVFIMAEVSNKEHSINKTTAIFTRLKDRFFFKHRTFCKTKVSSWIGRLNVP